MKETKLCILSKLSLDVVIAKLKASTVDLKKESQTNYTQIFQGNVGNDFAEIIDIYATPRNKILYKIKIESIESNVTRIIISNNKFETRQITNALLKALILPFGAVLIILNFINFSDLETLFTYSSIGVAFIVIPLMFNNKPLSEKEFLSDRVILSLIKIIEPIEIKLID